VRFLKGVTKVMEINLDEDRFKNLSAADSISPSGGYLSIRSNRTMTKIALGDVLYIESLKDYIKVVTVSKIYITKQSISAMEESLPKDTFIRIHRSFIVALKRIDSFTSKAIEVGDKELPISRMYSHIVKKALQNW
jgi:DNA-binding LytR/AlgR family response regulator